MAGDFLPGGGLPADRLIPLAHWAGCVGVLRARLRPTHHHCGAALMYEYAAVIRRVIDGDSIVVDVDMGRGIWVLKARHRLVGCNARKLSDPGGVQARANLLELIPEGTQVTLRSSRLALACTPPGSLS